MYSLIMLPLVIANVMLVVWLARSWLQDFDWLLLVTLVMMIALPYDVTIVMLGGVIGEGDLLRNLSVPRIIWLFLTAPLLLIIAVGIARRAGLRLGAVERAADHRVPRGGGPADFLISRGSSMCRRCTRRVSRMSCAT